MNLILLIKLVSIISSFNEYYLSENNESVLIWPDVCKLKKIREDYVSFYLEFLNIDNNKDTCYMNKRLH